ncbi:biotin--[acetyl-CoA-carboxylase] ligase [Dehalococcoidia bacterium]|nr:biotin--[acetyl-CoA-carboxylase] ligase [Dehalococcoidia bacterium]
MAIPLAIDTVRASMANTIIGRQIIYFHEVTSTMDVAREEAENGAKEGTVIVAEEQTAGRGRMGRHWFSFPGQNLSFSILLYPDATVCPRLSIAAPVAVLRAIRQVCNICPTLKWPNDVRIGEKKVSGVLIETAFQDTQVRYAIVGIGINVNFDPYTHQGIGPIATSLASESGKVISREELLKNVLMEFDAIYRHLNEWRMVWEDWQSSLGTLGKKIQVLNGGQIDEGLAEAVDNEGNLILRRKNGTLVTLISGEVTLQT